MSMTSRRWCKVEGSPVFSIVYRGKGKPCSTLTKWIRLIEFILSKNNLPTPAPLNRLYPFATILFISPEDGRCVPGVFLPPWRPC